MRKMPLRELSSFPSPDALLIDGEAFPDADWHLIDRTSISARVS
jgi:hypothetical protein